MDFGQAVKAKVREQLRSQRVGYLLGAGSSYLDGSGYPLSFELWDRISPRISDSDRKADIEQKLEAGAAGLEQALDLLDDGGAIDTPYRHLVTEAIAEEFITRSPPLDAHAEFLKRLQQRGEPCTKVFSLNYDPLLERAGDLARVRLVDGFVGAENAFFDPGVFEERVGRIIGTHRARQFQETAKPVRLLKLHGSLGWYEAQNGVRRCAYDATLPGGAKRLMVPPQRRKANDTMLPPYSFLWTTFRGCLGQNSTPLNRLACLGYSFCDEHVNAVIEVALARPDFTLLIFSKSLPDRVWARWSNRTNVIAVTETRCSLQGALGAGHADLWRFEQLCGEV